jgi:C1A family cysteine protease
MANIHNPFEEIKSPTAVTGKSKIVKTETLKAEIEITEQHAFGWIPDLPDFRDYSADHHEIKKLLPGKTNKLSANKAPVALPTHIDLRTWCPPVENQGSLGSCTANAGAALLEYFERRATGNHIDVSRLFLYKTTRNYMQVTGDYGAYLRTTMGAMVLFGVPPEKYWPYVIAKFDVEPSAFLYNFADNYKALKYYRLDPLGTTPANLLFNVKNHLNAGFPSMFGFTVYNSFYQAELTGKIPFPSATGDSIVGGHAIVAVGYDDTIKIKNALPGSVETKGALLIRNSWGTSWGKMGGYLWMPYEYITRGIATDFWTLISANYINTGMFNI